MSNPRSYITADLLKESVAVTLPGGEVKNLKYVDFLEIIQNHTGRLQEEQSNRGDQFVLPGFVRYFQKDANSMRVVLYFPEQKRNLFWRNDSNVYRDCCLPGVIIKVNLQKSSERGRQGTKWNVNGTRWYCTDLPFTDLPDTWDGFCADSDRRIWTLCVPNMYSDARMCTGENAMPTVFNTDLRPLSGLYEDVLVRGYFNNDLGVPSQDIGLGNESSLSLYSQCARFPYEILHGHPGRNHLPRSENNRSIAAFTRKFIDYSYGMSYDESDS